MTADPRIVQNAKEIAEISYQEAMSYLILVPRLFILLRSSR
jgi:uridylate kinase